MNKVFIIIGVLGIAQSSPIEPNVILKEDGSYKFNFDTGKEFGSIVRHEERHPDGTVIGRYSYEHPDGSVRVVNYRAGRQGFIATGDVGVAGAPPSQVPIVIPSIPEQPINEDPDQNIQDQDQNLQDVLELTTPVNTDDVDKDDVSTADRTESPENINSPVSKDETIKVAIPDEVGRKRAAVSAPESYSDNDFPFEAPAFGKRRLEAPEDDEKTPTDDDSDKKQDQVQPPTSYASDFPDSLKPQIKKHGLIDDTKQNDDPNSKMQGYYFYFPAPQPMRFIPGNHPSQHPVQHNQHQPAVPSAWAYVPISAFMNQNSPAPQPFVPPSNWAFMQPNGLGYVSSGKDDVQQHPALTPSAPHLPPPSSPERSDTQGTVLTMPDAQIQDSVNTNNPSVENNPDAKISVAIPQGQVQPAFHRPTVHHYNFRGPNHTYGYYYHY